MANLPTVGGSEDTWGDELVTWVQVEHESDGTHKTFGDTPSTSVIDDGYNAIAQFVKTTGTTPAIDVAVIADATDANYAQFVCLNTKNDIAAVLFAASTAAGCGTNSEHDFVIRTNTTDRIRITSAGKVGIGTSSPSVNADLTLEGGKLCLKETTTPTADTNYGKIYTKNDNKLYFQDGAGTEYTVDITPV
jgi:hypothetical protein